MIGGGAGTASIPFAPSRVEIERRHEAIREAAIREGCDAVIVCGSEYTGFEGALRYVSGFRIVHRYAYALIHVERPPIVVFPVEARWVGRHADSWIEEQVFAECCGEWLRQRLLDWGCGKIGIHGLDYVLNVRDYQALATGRFEIARFDAAFDALRAVKSSEELESVRTSIAINEAGFWAALDVFREGGSEADVMAAAEACFVQRGCARRTMNMVLRGDSPEFCLPEPRLLGDDDLLLPSLEIAGPGGHWVELSRPFRRTEPTPDLLEMAQALEESAELCSAVLRPGVSASDVHREITSPFRRRGYSLGHLTGHSIGMTMIEAPRIGDGVETLLEENMVLAIHPHVFDRDERTCLWMQDTWLVTASGCERLWNLPYSIFDGSESPI